MWGGRGGVVGGRREVGEGEWVGVCVMCVCVCVCVCERERERERECVCSARVRVGEVGEGGWVAGWVVVCVCACERGVCVCSGTNVCGGGVGVGG